ncbi:transcriptional regulator [Erwinia tracheiphila PSU-1]|nr:transcriptional regulator [Erwinia tracheiphila PSU-1]
MLEKAVRNHRYPGCLFIATCNFFSQSEHPVHQLAERQKAHFVAIHLRLNHAA